MMNGFSYSSPHMRVTSRRGCSGRRGSTRLAVCAARARLSERCDCERSARTLHKVMHSVCLCLRFAIACAPFETSEANANSATFYTSFCVSASSHAHVAMSSDKRTSATRP
jgi:hypothetical protein